MANAHGVSLLYSRQGAAESRPVQALRSAPDERFSMGFTSVAQPNTRLHVERAVVAVVRTGDQFVEGDRVHTVIDPVLDEGGVTWICHCTTAVLPSRGALLLAREAGL
jgi:hypothetical protein